MLNYQLFTAMTTIESRSRHPKRCFVECNDSDASIPQPGTTKRLRTETVKVGRGGRIAMFSPASQRLMAKFVQIEPQQPEPVSLRSPLASFLENFVDRPLSSPVPKRYHPEPAIVQWLESISGSNPTERGAVPPTPTSTRSHSYRADSVNNSRVPRYGQSA